MDSTFLARAEARRRELREAWPEHRLFLVCIRAISLQQCAACRESVSTTTLRGRRSPPGHCQAARSALTVPIVGDPQLPAKVALVLRCEPDGRTFVAIGLVPIDQMGSS